MVAARAQVILKPKLRDHSILTCKAEGVGWKDMDAWEDVIIACELLDVALSCCKICARSATVASPESDVRSV